MQTEPQISVGKLESRLNYLVGVTLMTNLYYISGLFSLPSILPIIGVLIISAYYFFKRINYSKLLFHTNFWMIIGFVVFSFFLYIPELIFRGSAFNPNDILRVLIYLFFVGWTLSIRMTWEAMARFFGLSALWALLVLLVLGFVEKEFPLLFALLLPSNLVRGNLTRIGATLIDPNTYSTALVVYFSAFFTFCDFVFKRGKIIITALLILPVFILIETSGSRQGLLLFLIWLFSLGLNKNWKATAITLFASIVVVFLLVLIFNEPLKNYAVQNPNTSVARILFPAQNKMSSLSDLERNASIEAGFNFIKSNFVVFGPGAFGYYEAYTNSAQSHGATFPHNGPLYLWTQYGVLSLYFLYLVYLLSKRAIKSGAVLFFLFFLIQFLILPNSSYYFLPVYLIFCIDTRYYYQVFQKQTQLAVGT